MQNDPEATTRVELSAATAAELGSISELLQQAALSTEDGIGEVALAWFLLQGNAAKADTGTASQRFITQARLRASNTIWREPASTNTQGVLPP